jgi:hypothetical protein
MLKVRRHQITAQCDEDEDEDEDDEDEDDEDDADEKVGGRAARSVTRNQNPIAENSRRTKPQSRSELMPPNPPLIINGQFPNLRSNETAWDGTGAVENGNSWDNDFQFDDVVIPKSIATQQRTTKEILHSTLEAPRCDQPDLDDNYFGVDEPLAGENHVNDALVGSEHTTPYNDVVLEWHECTHASSLRSRRLSLNCTLKNLNDRVSALGNTEVHNSSSIEKVCFVDLCDAIRKIVPKSNLCDVVFPQSNHEQMFAVLGMYR